LRSNRPAPISIDADAAAQHLAGAIRFRTVSDDEASAEAKAASAAELDAFRGYLAQTYPQTHAKLGLEVVAGHSLLYTWQGRDASLEPMLLAAHMDVVPADEGDKAWTHPPFDGVISDGFVWGRGAIDDKLCVIAILEAVEHLIGEGLRAAAHGVCRVRARRGGWRHGRRGDGGAAEIARSEARFRAG
jgi:carboxypeptidase PM20D1